MSLKHIEWSPNNTAITALHSYKIVEDGEKFAVEKIRLSTQKKEDVTGFESIEHAKHWCFHDHYKPKMNPWIKDDALQSVQVKILDKRIGQDERFPMPNRATDGSAGIDLRACIDEPVVIKAGASQLIGTGLAIYIKDDRFVGMILPRSGLGSNHGIILGNTVGLIDSDYQGELMVSVWNRSNTDYTLEPATKFAQYIIVPVATPALNIVDEFDSTTNRNQNGFGSTGVK